MSGGWMLYKREKKHHIKRDWETLKNGTEQLHLNVENRWENTTQGWNVEIKNKNLSMEGITPSC